MDSVQLATEELVEITVLQLSGQVVIRLNAHKEQTILAMKHKVSEQVNVPHAQLVLICEGVELPDRNTIQNSGVTREGEATFYVIFRPGRRVLTGSPEGLQLWDLESRLCVQTFGEKGISVKSVAVDWVGRQVVSGCEDGLLRLWDLDTGDFIRGFREHRSGVTCVTVDWANKQLLSGSNDGYIILWDLLTAFPQELVPGTGPGVRALSADWEGRQALSSRASFLQLWDVDTGHCLQALTGHKGHVLTFAVDWVGKQALSGGTDCYIRVWELSGGTCCLAFRITVDRSADYTPGVGWTESNDAILAMSVDWPEKQVLIGCQDGKLQLWDFHAGLCIRTFDCRGSPVCVVTADWAGKLVLSGSCDRHLRLWNLDDSCCLVAFEKSRSPIKALAASWW